MNGTKALVRSGICLGKKSQGICENASSDDFLVTMVFIIVGIGFALYFFYKKKKEEEKARKEEAAARKKQEKEARRQKLIQDKVASVLASELYRKQVIKMTPEEYADEEEHLTNLFDNTISTLEILEVEARLKTSFSPAKKLAGRFPK